jgi:hypothetical protein
MEVPQQTCRGTKSDGSNCTRTLGLNAGGYCYQHTQQDIIAPSTPVAPPVAPPVQSANSFTRESSSTFGSNNNSNNEPEQDAQQRCSATATTTRTRCKKLVSMAGERFCPAHGGAQLKQKVASPMCNAVSQRSGEACKNHISVAGEAFCSHHGGKRKTVQRLLIQAPPTSSLLSMFTNPLLIPRGSSSNLQDVNWTNIQNACVHFVLDTHIHSKCNCVSTEQPCRRIVILQWVQALSKLASASPGASIVSAHASDLAMFIPTTAATDNTTSSLFSDLYIAVEIFGTDISFLPHLFKHIQGLNIEDLNEEDDSQEDEVF